MRQIAKILILLFLCVSSIQSQKVIVWFDAGLKAQAGPTGLYNKAVVDRPEVEYSVSSGNSFGGKFGINFGYNALTIDLMYNNSKAEFQHQNFVGDTEVKTKSLDLYLLYRNEKNLSYFEIGPKLSFLRDASWRQITDGASPIPTDITDQFKNGIGAVIGFGANLLGTEGSFSGKLGLRFEYGITDVVNDIGMAANAPLNETYLYADGYKGSHPIFAGVVFELNWGIGYYGVTKCGGRSKFFMF